MPEALSGKQQQQRGKLLKFFNCSLLRDHKVIVDDLWVRNGKILDPKKIFYDEQALADVRIDCGGLLLAPGFIDAQINGNDLLRFCF